MGEEKESEAVRLQRVDNTGSPDSDNEDYDPHLHRVVEKPTSNIETLVHLLKCSLGTGILAMPQAFSRSGLITGVIATIIIGGMITHCLHVLVKAQYNLCKRRRVPLLTYPESMVAALEIGPRPLRRFAKSSAVVVDVFLVVYQLGICCVYTVFIAGTFKKIVDPYYEMSIEVHMLIIMLPLIAANCIRHLKILAPFSNFANFLTLVGLGIVVYYLLTAEKSTEPLDLFGSLAEFPLFFGTTLFALTAVGVVVALENNMESPKDFGKPLGVLNLGMAFIVTLYVVIGVIGYIFCVSSCSDSITLDMPEGTALTISVLVMYAIAILISYVLQCYVPVEILWKTYTKPQLEKRGYIKLLRWEYALRILVCLLTFVLAVSVPRLGLFISLFGALCLSALGMMFPAFMEVCVAMPDKFGPGKIILIKDIILFIIGLFGMVVGTYSTVVAIIKSFQ
ncbi:proton-coupled amino acid transporter-like protein CG1139 [Pectinophora gossypiella]|uniref:proton-coupled amino acid transporter-like protein CG1139 n=1 Tax=Pectinophora gossypiella TaxID=13191 RepID=UPI00214F415C|nr:proton-coupled amino acid transporter-like protein CG1139 [Pectinophora gossypiella]